MKKLMIGAAAIALLGACGQRGGDSAEQAAEAGQAAMQSAENALEDLGNVVLRRGDAAEAEAALAAMYLDTAESGRVGFASRDVSGAAASFEDVSIDIPGEDGDAGGSFKAARLELEGLEMTDSGASFSKMKFSGIELVPDDPVDAEEGQLTIDEIELLNPSPALAAWVASLMGDGAPTAFPDASEIGFDAWTMSDLDFNLDSDDDTVALSVNAIQIGGVTSDAMAVAHIDGVSIDGVGDGDTPFAVSLASMTLSGADLSFTQAISDNIEDEEAMAAALMSALYQNPMDPGFDSYAIDQLNFDAAGLQFVLPSLVTTVERNQAGQPVRFVTPEFTMTLSADPEGGEAGGELAGALGMVGYETVELSSAGVSNYDPDSDTLTFAADQNYLTLKDGFTLRYGGKLEGYNAYASSFANMDFENLVDGGDPDPALMQDALSKLVFHDFELTLVDDSIVDRIFNLVAAQSGEDPEMVRNQAVGVVAMAPMMAGGSGVDVEMITEVTTAISAFLTNPGTLSIKLAPSEPLSMASLAAMEDPSMLTKEYLGLTATHTE